MVSAESIIIKIKCTNTGSKMPIVLLIELFIELKSSSPLLLTELKSCEVYSVCSGPIQKVKYFEL